jgi:glycerol uptake facilitator-like aquaporin
MNSAMPRPETCFVERDPGVAIVRRAMVEGVGTLLLVLAATGAGLTASRLLSDSTALSLLASAVATAGALVGLIVAFGAVSGGHFNPLITGLQWLAGDRKLDCTLAYITAQFLGGVSGALLADLVFGAGWHPAVLPTVGWKMVASEAIASAGLMIVVFGCSRSGRKETGPFAVGAWLTAAIIATPSTSYANPAIAVAALFATGPISVSPATAVFYVAAEVAGALVALSCIAISHPRRSSSEHPMVASPTAPAGTPP